MSNLMRWCTCVALCAYAVLPAVRAQVPGVSDHEILIGSCSVLDGPASQLGRQFVMGATAYLNMINDAGGVNGRKIALRAYEDGYDASLAPRCFERLQQDRVFAASFLVGTPTAARYVPLAEANRLPLVGLFTGAELIYNPLRHYVLNVRASYFDETRMEVDLLWAHGIRSIAIVYPDDAFGSAVLNGLRAALKGHAASPCATASYPHNSQLVDDAVQTVRQSHTEAVLLVGPYGSVAAMLRQAAGKSWHPLFLSVSFVDTDDLIRGAGSAAEGLIVTQVMPPPSAIDLPTVRLYRRQMAGRFPNAALGYVSLEGFVDAMVLVEGLKRAGRDLSREKLIRALESMHNVDLGLGPEVRLNLSANNHKGFQIVFPTVVDRGVAIPLNWGTLAAKK